MHRSQVRTFKTRIMSSPTCKNVVKVTFTCGSCNNVNEKPMAHPAISFLPTPADEISILAKQWHDIELLINQYYERLIDGCNIGCKFAYFAVDAEWLRAWHNKLLSPVPCAPGKITNWKLVDGAIDNRFVYESCKYRMKQDLREGVDYFLLPKDAWDAAVEWFGCDGPPLPRTAICLSKASSMSDVSIIPLIHGDHCKVDIYPDEVLTVSDAQTLKVVVDDRMIAGDSIITESIATVLKSHSSVPVAVAVNEPWQLNDCGDLAGARNSICFVCRLKSTNKCSNCKSVLYCSKACQAIHWAYHKTWCKAALLHKNCAPAQFQTLVPIGKRGNVGLTNLGNSCYMSSSLQCLSHISPLTSYFLGDKYKTDLNPSNKSGTGGALAKEYSDLLRTLWCDSKLYMSPLGMKKALGRLNPDYMGLAQHDAHEVIELLLDKLHEDVNKVHVKPYTENTEGDGTNDIEMARQSWEKHCLREDSKVKEIVGSQMRSEVVCPDCGKVSVSFDYQQTIQLAIPSASNRTVTVVYVPTAGTITGSIKDIPREVMRPRSCEVHIDKLSVMKQVGEAAVMALGLDSENVCYHMFESDAENRKIHRYLSEETVLYSVHHQRVVLLYKVPPNSNSFAFIHHRWVEWSLKEYTVENPDLWPLFIAVDPSWSSARFRATVWQQLLPLINLESLLGKAILHCEKISSTMKAQLLFSKHLPLRLCNHSAVGKLSSAPMLITDRMELLVSVTECDDEDAMVVENGQTAAMKLDVQETYSVKGDRRVTTSTGMTERFGTDNGWGFGTCDRYLGTIIPADKSTSIGMIAGISKSIELIFVAVDWFGSSPWAEAVDWKEVQSWGSQSSSNSSNTKKSDLQDSILHTLKEEDSPTSSAAITLEQCLREHTRPEKLSEGNEWYCNVCKKHQSATRNAKFWKPKLPKVLILSLKRFEFRDITQLVGSARRTTHREKIENFVDFPLNSLDIAPYCAEMRFPTSADDSASVEQYSTTYDLFAVCNHYGRMGFGHYTAMARDWHENMMSSAWCHYDDSDVTACAKVQTNAAYILFYRQRQLPSSAPSSTASSSSSSPAAAPLQSASPSLDNTQATD